MAAAASLPASYLVPEDVERRVLLPDVPWSTYVVLRDTVDSSGIRMTYLRGQLEIMSPSQLHEVSKTQIARLLELFCLERDIRLFGYGSMTLRREEKERGIEPDECYSVGPKGLAPDVAIEVVVTAPLLDKLEVYRGLGVREVWVFRSGAFSVFVLEGEAYTKAAASGVLPQVDLVQLARFALMEDQHAALVGYRSELRQM